MPYKEFRLGSGKLSGVLSLTMALMALGATLCFHFPSLLTTPQLREVYPVELIRLLIWIFIAVSALFAVLSWYLSPGSKTGLFGGISAIAALALGGGGVHVEVPVPKSNYAGLDWFILDLLLLAAIFIPLERLFPLKEKQRIFRKAWRLDLGYFFTNHVLIQVILAITAIPALFAQGWVQGKVFPAIADWNPVVQFVLILLSVDLLQYWVHRAFHQIPRLWKFHAIHHSVEEMDWLAGSRLHIVDILLTRSVLFLPIAMLGFRPGVLQSYLIATAFGTVFTHTNIRWRFPLLELLIATPAYHHWHHSSERSAIDTNFAVHLPCLDWIFGTYYFPSGKWPKDYGLDREKLPATMRGQFLYPF